MPVVEAAERLRASGEIDAADALATAGGDSAPHGTEFFGGPLSGRRLRPWQHSSHAFGFLPLEPVRADRLPLLPAGAIEPDRTLAGQRINVTLDRLGVAEYPGRGTHRVLINCYGRHISADSRPEGINFAVSLRARDGEHASVMGWPIFVGLQVGDEGVAFRAYTLCIASEDDEALVSFLESEVFRAGLKLTSAIQPAVGLVASMMGGLTKALAERRSNVPVHEFALGLDFTAVPTRAALAEGSYVVVQIPETHAFTWDWEEWAFDVNRGRVVRADDPTETLPYNYMIFSVTRAPSIAQP
jgi:hypothetical protein